MKKKYMKPTMREFRIQHHRIICASPPESLNNRFVMRPAAHDSDAGGMGSSTRGGRGFIYEVHFEETA